MKCGERDYLVPESQKSHFLEWVSKEIAKTDLAPQIQPYFVGKGDNQKRLDNCIIHD